MKFRVLSLALASALSVAGLAQITPDQLSARLRVQQEADKREAISLANLLGLPMRMTLSSGSVAELVKFRDGHPMYVLTDNKNAAITTRANLVHPGGRSGYSLTGSTITLGEWDGGSALSTHLEFGGRVTVMDGSASMNHSTHVAGTLIAAGIDPNAKGMAYQGLLKSWDWNSDASEMAAAGLLVSNHSYGYITGWSNNGGTWYWYGNQADAEDVGFGYYDETAQSWDQVANTNPNYLIFKSAGNDRGEGPAGQPISHKEWNGSAWVGATTVRQIDGGASGFDTLPYYSVAKNVMTVGAVNDVLSYTGPASVVMTGFSGWGPADDGRIKPDIVADGASLYSASNAADNAYTTMSGTSMSTPNACGSAALIQQASKSFQGFYLSSAALRGLIIHTALECGPNPGPDYMFGWGLMNTEGACALVRSNSMVGNPYLYSRFRPEVIARNEFHDRKYHSSGGQIKVTICWNDPAAIPSTPVVDWPQRALINDLDLTVIGPGGTFWPYRLDPNNPSAPPVKGQNHVDNVEQVVIDGAPAGDYTVRVSAQPDNLEMSQEYALFTTNLVAVEPNFLAFSVTPAMVQGGVGSSAWIQMDGPEYFTKEFTMSSGNPALANINPHVRVETYAHELFVPIATSPVLAVSNVTITAVMSGTGTTKTAILKLIPGFQLYGLRLNRSIMIGGETPLLATATMTGNASSPQTVGLVDSTTALNSPASIIVPAGYSKGAVTIPSVAVVSETTTIVTASYLGITRAATVIVIPVPKLMSVAMNPTSVQGGATSTGTVTLDRWAPTGGLIVALGDNSANITVPSSVQIVGGLKTATFTATTTPVTVTQTKTVSASYHGFTKTTTLTLTP